MSKINLTPLNSDSLSPKVFSQWVQSLESLDNKEVTDQDFLITYQDRPEKAREVTLPVELVLDNIRSSFNVGGLFRTCESFGIKKIHLCGYTPTPENSKTAKSALGTENWIDWQYWESSLECLKFQKEQGHYLVAMETQVSAKDLKSFHPTGPVTIVLGNERYGLNEPVLNLADEILQITMHGRKNSLNVGVCGALAIDHVIGQLL